MKTKNEYYKDVVLYHDKNDVSIKVTVSVGKDYETQIGKPLENFGYIEIESVRIDDKEKCFWDNLNFFLKAPKADIEKECKSELIRKELFYKGIFKDLNDMLKDLLKAGYLTKECKKDY